MLRKHFCKAIHFWRQNWLDWAIPAALLLLLLGSLAVGWLMRDTVQEVIVDNIAYFLWSLRLRLRALPQEEVWRLVALVALAHLFISMSRNLTLPSVEPGSYKKIGPVRSWIDILDLNRRPDQMGRIPLNRLQQLALMVLAEQSHQSLNDLRARLRTGSLEIDPALQTFLQTGRSQTADWQTRITDTPEMTALLNLLEQKVGDNTRRGAPANGQISE
jgi:hypothetical protein